MFSGIFTLIGFIFVICSLVLFVKNLIIKIRLRRLFLRMNFMYIIGSIGSGKTALAVYINFLYYKMSKRNSKYSLKRASSFPIDLPDQRIFNYGELFLDDFKVKTPVNSLLTLDEIQFFQVGSDFIKNRSLHKSVAQFLSIMRHNDNKAIFVGQRLNDLWVELRNRVNLFVYCVEFKRLWYCPFIWRFSFFYTFDEFLFQDLIKKYAVDGISFKNLFVSKGAIDSGYAKFFVSGRFLRFYDSKHLAFVVDEKNFNSLQQDEFHYEDKYSTYDTVSKAGYFELIPLLNKIKKKEGERLIREKEKDKQVNKEEGEESIP